MNNEIKLALTAANNEGRKQLKNKGVISPSDSTTYQIMTAISNIDTNILDLSSIVFDDDNNICITDLENNQHKIHYDLSNNGYIIRILYDNYEIPLKYNGLELTQIEDTEIDLSQMVQLSNGFSTEAKTEGVNVYYPIYIEEQYPNYFVEMVNAPTVQALGGNEITVYRPIYFEDRYPNYFKTMSQIQEIKTNSNIIVPEIKNMSTWSKTPQADKAFSLIDYNSEQNNNHCLYVGVDGYENIGFSKLLKAGYKYIFSLEFYSPTLLNTSPNIAPRNIFMGFFPLNKILENANIYNQAYSSCVFSQDHLTDYYKYKCEYIPDEDIGCSIGLSFGSLSDFINCEFYIKNINLIEEVNN